MAFHSRDFSSEPLQIQSDESIQGPQSKAEAKAYNSNGCPSSATNPFPRSDLQTTAMAIGQLDAPGRSLEGVGLSVTFPDFSTRFPAHLLNYK